MSHKPQPQYHVEDQVVYDQAILLARLKEGCNVIACLNCNSLFEPKPRSKYCSNWCSAEAGRKRARQLAWKKSRIAKRRMA